MVVPPDKQQSSLVARVQAMAMRKPAENLKFPERKWIFGMEGVPRSDRQAIIAGSASIEPTGQLVPGNTGEGRNESEETRRGKKKEYVEKKAWDVAMAPGKQLPMTAFMMWMMGSQVNIFTLMFNFYQFFAPIKGLMSLNSAFQSIADSAKDLGVDLLLHKLVYIACQLGFLLMITHRLGSMGLLPTSASDWLAAVPIRTPVEFSSGGIPMHQF